MRIDSKQSTVNTVVEITGTELWHDERRGLMVRYHFSESTKEPDVHTELYCVNCPVKEAIRIAHKSAAAIHEYFLMRTASILSCKHM